MNDNKISDDYARDAYLYGYSADEAYKYFYNTSVVEGTRLNSLDKLPDIPDDTYTDHPSINNDTLHIMGWIDVASEPVIFEVPDHDEGRYWLLHAMDMDHYTVAMIGSRVRGTKGGKFMFASRSWDGTVPGDIDEVIRTASDILKVMPRIMAITAPADLAKARALQQQWNLRTLSDYLGTAPVPPVQRDFPNPANTNWLERVNFVLAQGSMADLDRHWIEQSRDIGIEPGKSDFTEEQLDAIKRGETLGMDLIKKTAPEVKDARRLLGTREQLQDGDRLDFCEGTYLGQWGLPPEESMYFQLRFDTFGNEASGANGQTYRIVMPDPNVKCFWSLTAYRDSDRLMDHNELGRHSRGDRTLIPSPDGSYEIELGADCTGKADDPNFLPVPAEGFYLILRLYGPDQDTIDGKYKVPGLEALSVA